MKILFFVFSVILTTSVIAQDDIPDRDRLDRPVQIPKDNIIIEESQNLKESGPALSVFGVVNEASNQTKNDFNAGLGAFVEFIYQDNLGLETGAYYIKNQYAYSDQNILFVSEADRLHFPVLVKYWPVHFLNVGLGPYASLRLSDEDKIFESETSQAITDGSDRVEYGLDVAGNLTFSLDDKSGLFAGVRYSYPLKEQARDRIDNQATFLAGFRIQL
jgi:hypothetical protein